MNAETLTIPGPARSVGMEAVCELAALLQHAITLCPLVDAADQTPLVVRGVLLRAATLTSVLMSMMDNELPQRDIDLRLLQRRVVGEAAAALEAGAS